MVFIWDGNNRVLSRMIICCCDRNRHFSENTTTESRSCWNPRRSPTLWAGMDERLQKKKSIHSELCCCAPLHPPTNVRVDHGNREASCSSVRTSMETLMRAALSECSLCSCFLCRTDLHIHRPAARLSGSKLEQEATDVLRNCTTSVQVRAGASTVTLAPSWASACSRHCEQQVARIGSSGPHERWNLSSYVPQRKTSQ